MSIRVLVVDDELHGIEGVTTLVRRVPELDLVGFETDPLTALNKIVSGIISVDLLFLDVDMPDMNGLKMSELLGDKVLIIFVTSYSHYAVDAFGPSAVDFLTKPIDPVKFMKAVQRARDRLAIKPSLIQQTDQRYIFVNLSPRNIIKVKLESIVYIKSKDKELELHIGEKKPLIVKKALNSMVEILPADRFMRIHKSHIVNLDYITGIVGNQINLENSIVLVIGSTYIDAVYARFKSI